MLKIHDVEVWYHSHRQHLLDKGFSEKVVNRRAYRVAIYLAERSIGLRPAFMRLKSKRNSPTPPQAAEGA